ncbi:MAG TPA: glycosyltransferase, partial [Acetobacteraceae bacterium]|nr:glycosyltransferase [Acetobacteraceae bacterium]
WYADTRDLADPRWCELQFYESLADLDRFRPRMAAADAVIVGSYVPEGVAVARLARATAGGVLAFYDIDTPVTLAKLESGDHEYLAPEIIPSFDVYLSFTGGDTLRVLERRWRAKQARALYCSVDDTLYEPLDLPRRWDLGYLGTYSEDRQSTLERLLIETARRMPEQRFVVAGPQYPDAIEWPANVERIEHIPPAGHADFYASCGWTLNVTRADMRAVGWSPSVRLFEAAACATPIISDTWPGLSTFFTPGTEIVIAERTEDVIRALGRPEIGRAAVGRAGRVRVRTAHTAGHRARLLEAILRLVPAMT